MLAYKVLLFIILRLSSPPTIAKLRIAAYEGAQCDIWP